VNGLLACPHDGSPLARNGDALACADGGHAFDVRDGVAVLVEDAGEQAGTSDSFSVKWDAFREADRERSYAFQHRWYLERYGFDGEDALADFLRGRQTILDAGCGLGRDVARYARLSDAEVVGIDLSDAVFRARREVDGPRTHFLRADILAPPFRPRTFDLVVADQVIHHTPDCPRAFRTLAELVRPGGQIAAYVYRRKALVRELADTHVRDVTTRMSPEECFAFAEQLTELGRALSDLNATVTLEQGVPLLGIEPGEHDVQRLVYWHLLKCFWSDELGHETSVLTNFDWYHPPFASRHTPEEVRSWCEEAGLEVVHLGVVESGISVRAERPAGQEDAAPVLEAHQ
jgi:SAM-dependent methyltransferase/uncharacterized protein YbaR (Trm112 family)